MTRGPGRWFNLRESSQVAQKWTSLEEKYVTSPSIRRRAPSANASGYSRWTSVRRTRQGTVDVDGDRSHSPGREQLLKAVNHPLRPAQTERRDHNPTLKSDRPRDDRVKLLHQHVVGL